MQNNPGPAYYYPPPPPPQGSRKGLWIGLAIGAVVLCLCCIVIVVGISLFGKNIPFISSFFASPTPTSTPTSTITPTRTVTPIPTVTLTPISTPTSTGLTYNNPSIGINLTYPLTWQYSESGDATNGYTVTFASSAEILTSGNIETGAMLILLPVLPASGFPSTVDSSSLGTVVDYFANSMVSTISQAQDPRTFTVSGYPAASGIVTELSPTGTQYTGYIIAVLRNDDIILFMGACTQTEWTQHKPTFDSIVNSAIIVQP